MTAIKSPGPNHPSGLPSGSAKAAQSLGLDFWRGGQTGGYTPPSESAPADSLTPVCLFI